MSIVKSGGYSITTAVDNYDEKISENKKVIDDLVFNFKIIKTDIRTLETITTTHGTNLTDLYDKLKKSNEKIEELNRRVKSIILINVIVSIIAVGLFVILVTLF